MALTSCRSPCDPLADRPARGLIVAAVLLTFWPVLLGSYVADDLRLLTHNPAVRSGDVHALLTQPMFRTEGGYWRPATMFTLWLGNMLGGAFGVHLLALLLHASNALAVRALAARWVSPAAATWVAVLFAVHPVQVESVGWCAAINDPLWSACALQAMLAGVRWRDRSAGGVPWAAAAWAFGALAAKETGVVAIPLACVAVAWVPGAVPAAPWARRRTILAMAGTGLAWLLVRALVQHEWPGQVLTGNVAPVAGVGELARAAHLLVAQCALLVWPWPTLLTRSMPVLAAEVAAAVAALVAAGAALVWWRCRARTELLFAAALVVLPLLPPIVYSRAVGVYAIADRYLYLCVAGFAIAAAALLRDARVPWLAWLLTAVLAPLTFSATWIWHDSEHLVTNSLAHAPHDPMVLVMAGDLALDKAFAGDRLALLGAEARYADAAALAEAAEPGEQQRSALANARLGLAWCTLLRHGSRHEAEAEVIGAFRRAVDAAPNGPMAWVGLAAAHAEFGQFDAAEQALAAAQALDPQCAAARSGLARVRAASAAASR